MPHENARPTYLDKLNQLAITEGRAYDFYRAWADKTSDPQLAQVMRFVAVREIEHSWALRKRIVELGYEFEDRPCPQCDEWMALFSSDATDLEKFHGFGFHDTEKFPADDFADLFNDLTLDFETGAVLGRYIAEERDSATLFLREFARLKAEAAPLPSS